MAYVYMILCEDDTIYTGLAADVEKRLAQHLSGGKKCAKYTRARGVKALLALWETDNLKDAARLEYAIKHITRAKKERLVEDNSLAQSFFPKLSEICFTPVDVSLLESMFHQTE